MFTKLTEQFLGTNWETLYKKRIESEVGYIKMGVIPSLAPRTMRVSGVC